MALVKRPSTGFLANGVWRGVRRCITQEWRAQADRAGVARPFRLLLN
jgi:hypothetical protein